MLVQDLVASAFTHRAIWLVQDSVAGAFTHRVIWLAVHLVTFLLCIHFSFTLFLFLPLFSLGLSCSFRRLPVGHVSDSWKEEVKLQLFDRWKEKEAFHFEQAYVSVCFWGTVPCWFRHITGLRGQG